MASQNTAQYSSQPLFFIRNALLLRNKHKGIGSVSEIPSWRVWLFGHLGMAFRYFAAHFICIPLLVLGLK
jgi:hypothetical protein